MKLKATGTVLGVRSEEYTNKSTGEIKTRRTLDLYDPEDGPAELGLRDDIDSPEPGALVTVTVAVRSFSGFVNEKQGVAIAGDAKTLYSVTAIEYVGRKPRAVKAG